MTRQPPREYAQVLDADVGEVDGLLQHEGSVAVARRLVDLTARLVPHAEHAAVTVVGPGSPVRTTAATGPVATAVDALQSRTGQGPSLETVGAAPAVSSGDLCVERRWPGFSGPCADVLGIRSMLSVRLAVPDGHRVALSLYASAPQAFDDGDLGTAAMLAPFLALALGPSQRDGDALGPIDALDASRRIGTAVGILTARYAVAVDEAFAVLRGTSGRLRRQVRDVADDVVALGDLPAGEDEPHAGGVVGTPARGG
jgi:hypothetical protein